MLKRVITAVIAGGISLAALLAPNPLFFLAWCVVVGIACSFELGGRSEPIGVGIANVLIATLFGALTYFYFWNGGRWAVEFFILICAPALLAWWCLAKNRYAAAWPAIVGIAMVCLFILRVIGHDATWILPIMSVAVVAWIPLWVGDSAAYFVGKAIGKHKMAPQISPNKTWEGAAANLVGCVLAAMAFSLFTAYELAFLAVIGLIAGIFGQAGDLMQSSWKRKQNKKDSGGLLPGHGGVLDRLDSLLFSVPFATLAYLAFYA